MIELGLRCQALLDSHTFKYIVDFLSESYADNILASAGHERQKREENYHLHQSLQHIVGQLGAFAAAGQALIDEQEQKEDE